MARADMWFMDDTALKFASDDNYVIARVSPAYQGSNFLKIQLY